MAATEATHKGVLTENAPNPMPHIFPQAVVTTNGFVFCSGSIAMDPKTLKVIDGDIQAHTVSANSGYLLTSDTRTSTPDYPPQSVPRLQT